MRVVNIDHLNIMGAPELIALCRAFYIDVIGLAEGPRPGFRSRGHWLYAGDRPVVHLSEAKDERVRAKTPLDHIAFACEGLDGFIERLEERSIPHHVDRVPERSNVQIFLHDPAGVGLELNFKYGVAGSRGLGVSE
jgi:catechol-2,3-dioxygenase